MKTHGWVVFSLWVTGLPLVLAQEPTFSAEAWKARLSTNPAQTLQYISRMDFKCARDREAMAHLLAAQKPDEEASDLPLLYAKAFAQVTRDSRLVMSKQNDSFSTATVAPIPLENVLPESLFLWLHFIDDNRLDALVQSQELSKLPLRLSVSDAEFFRLWKKSLEASTSPEGRMAHLLVWEHLKPKRVGSNSFFWKVALNSKLPPSERALGLRILSRTHQTPEEIDRNAGILLIDDSPEVRRETLRLLGRRGHEGSSVLEKVFSMSLEESETVAIAFGGIASATDTKVVEELFSMALEDSSSSARLEAVRSLAVLLGKSPIAAERNQEGFRKTVLKNDRPELKPALTRTLLSLPESALKFSQPTLESLLDELGEEQSLREIKATVLSAKNSGEAVFLLDLLQRYPKSKNAFETLALVSNESENQRVIRHAAGLMPKWGEFMDAYVLEVRERVTSRHLAISLHAAHILAALWPHLSEDQKGKAHVRWYQCANDETRHAIVAITGEDRQEQRDPEDPPPFWNNVD